MTNYVVLYRDHARASDSQALVIAVEGCTAYEVAQYVRQTLGHTHDVVVSETGPDAVPSVWLRWEGDDFNHGGTEQCRRMQHRKVVATAWPGPAWPVPEGAHQIWSDWEDV